MRSGVLWGVLSSFFGVWGFSVWGRRVIEGSG